MKIKNTSRVMIGISFLCLSFLSCFYAYQMFQKKEQLRSRNLQVAEELDLIESKLKEKKTSISLASLVKQAEAVYQEDGTDIQEGYLWIDRKSDQYVVTLGAYNDVMPGEHLSVFAGKRKLGEVKVEVALDIISYVVPTDDAMDLTGLDYYRVLKK